MGRILLSYLFVIFSVVLNAQQTPAPKQTKSILLLNGTAHIGNGHKINRSAIVLEDGKITKVVNALTTTIDESKYDTVIDIKDHHVYPGFIAPNSTLGLMEIGAVRATKDYREVGEFNPHIRAGIAYNTDSRITPTVRTNGVLVGQATPRGGYISGASSIVHFDAWNWEDAMYKMDDGVHLNWPRRYLWWGRTAPKKEYPDQVKKVREFFTEAMAYYKGDNQGEIDLRLEAMKGVFDGTKKLYVHASDVKELSDAINFKRSHGVKEMVIVGGYDAWMVADRLKENNIAVVLKRVHSLPQHNDEDVDLPFKMPKILQDAGVLFCLENSGDMEQMGTRNLPFYAGTAAAYGLEYEEAVAAISSNAAKILGVDDKLGTIEEGKDATIFVSKGDALDMRTNDVTHAYIQGRSISLDNHQIQNYQKYKTKYGLK